MPPDLRRKLHRLLRRFGVEVRRFEPDDDVELRRARIMRDRAITLALDVGANEGRYVMMLRRNGYAGRVVSFEPLSTAHARLARRAARDPAWQCRRTGLGSAEGAAEINVAANSVSSSLLAMNRTHLSAAPQSATVGSETVDVRRLDALLPDILGEQERVWLKVDVQGFEKEVLAGAGDFLRSMSAIEIELSLAPLYDGQPLIGEMIDYLDAAGFALVSMDRGLTDAATAHILQIDGIFVRREPE